MILNYLLVYWTIYATKINIKSENLLRTISSNIPYKFFFLYFQLIAKIVYLSAKGIPRTRIRFPFIVITYFFDVQDRFFKKGVYIREKRETASKTAGQDN